MSTTSCKTCRRAGEKLFLKGDRCFTAKCAVVRKPYPPGVHTKSTRRRRNESEYGMQLREKQKLRNVYHLREEQFRRYVQAATQSRTGDAGTELLRLLAQRLDNAVFQAGFAQSRSIARQLVGHGHVHVNGKRTRIPSYRVKPGDTIVIGPRARSGALAEREVALATFTPPSWITLDPEEWRATVATVPDMTDQAPLYNTKLIIEYYAR